MDDEAYGECDLCGKAINFGNAMVTINRNVEQADQTDQSEMGEITVIDSDELITLCANCGSRFSREVLRELLKLAIKHIAEPN